MPDQPKSYEKCNIKMLKFNLFITIRGGYI